MTSNRATSPAHNRATSMTSSFARSLATLSESIVAHPEGVGSMLLLTQGTSLRGTMFNIANTVLGAGILGLPYCADQTGIVMACSMLVVVALFQDMSAWMLLVSVDATKEISFAVVAETLYSKPVGILVDAMVLLNNFGSLTAYVVILGDLLPSFMAYVHAPQVLASRILLVLILTVVLLVPLSSLRKMGLLRFASMFTLAVIGTFVVVLACMGFGWIAISHEGSSAEPILSTSFLKVATELPMCLFAYNCNMNVPILYGELRRQGREEVESRFRSKRTKMMISMHVALFICCSFYCLAAITGCLAFRGRTETNVFKNMNAEEFGASPYLKLTYAIALCCSFPVMCFSCVASLHRLVWSAQRFGEGRSKRHVACQRAATLSQPLPCQEAVPDGEQQAERHEDAGDEWLPSEHALQDAAPPEPSCAARQIEVVFIVGVSVAFGLAFPNLGAVFNLTGGVCGSFLSFIFPGMFFYKVHSSPLSRTLGATIASLGAIVAIATPILLLVHP